MAFSLSSQSPRRVGIFAIVGIAVIALVVTVLSNASFGAHTYNAEVANTGGLVKGEDVRVAGVNVGEVKSVTLDRGKVKVRFTVQGDIKLGSDTTAEIKVATLLGTHYLAIDPKGSGSLSDNTIALANTTVPYNLQDVIDATTTQVQALDPDLMARALSTIADIGEAAGPEVRPAIAGIADVSKVIATRTRQGADLLEAAKHLSAQLSDSTGDMVTLMKQSTLILNEINTRREAIHALLVSATDLAGSMRTIVRQTKTSFTVSLKDMRTVLQMLRGEDKKLRSALSVMGASVRYVANATGSGPWLSIAIPGAIPDQINCHLEKAC